MLYLCSFVNFAAIVADYNVADSQEMGGKGPTLDTDYLASLGPQAIPAIDRFLAIRQPASLVARRDTLAHWRRAALNSWRAWAFRGWRLKRYLDRTSAPKAANHLSVPAPSIP